MKQLFVSDLDGTLLNGASLISPYTAATISELTRRGALITVATARTPATVTTLLSDTHISLPAIVFTGAAEFDVEARRYVEAKLLTPAMAQFVEETMLLHGLTPLRYTLGSDEIIHTYYNGAPPHPTMQKFIDQRSHLALKRMHINEACCDAELRRAMILLFAMGPAEAVAAVERILNERGGCYVSTYTDPFYPGVSVIEVYTSGVSKAAAVKEMATRVGADRVVVFGDNLNDLPMMGVADLAVAVDNAVDEVKQAADLVIGPNTADAVARFIKKSFESH